jgi:protein-disulfide isomerase
MTAVSLLVVSLLVSATAAAAELQDRPPLVVASAEAEVGSGTLTITGSGFGGRPFVTLNLIPLTVRVAIDTRIVAAAPIGIMPPGQYLLTVSRGPAGGDTASFDVTLGASSAAGSASDAKVGAAGPTIKPENSAFASPDDVAAKVGDRSITIADVDREWQRTDPGSYVGVARRIHEMRRRAADKLVADDLIAREAAARGVSVEALLGEEIPKRTVPLPDSAALALYQQLGDDARGASLDQMRPALRAWLARFTEPDLARMNYVEELMRVSTRVDVLLPPPRIEVASSDADPSLGPAAAAVQIVAFGDLRNGRYAAFAQAFGRVRETFGDRVRVVFKHLPGGDPESHAAAEAAACAHAQGKFWAFHDRVIEQSGPLGATRTAELALAAGLDRAAFEACRDSGRFRRANHDALEEARRYDITGSPSFLVNGRLAPVPPPFLPPFEFFTRLVEEELATLARAR